MLKKSLLIALGALVAQGAFAEVLSPEAALQRASSQNGGRRLISANAQPKLAFTAKTVKGQPAVYVFNQGANAILVSASDKALPVLGYMDSGDFDPNNLPPQMEYWLNEYAAQIAYAEENNITPSSTNVSFTYPSDWTFISPLCQTKWDQGKPYNSQLKSSAYATGCVATAMAQVMKYHNYPEIGKGYNSYTDVYGNTYAMDFAQQPFDWANMLNDYSGSYTNEQANAVAYLMKACGYSTDMNYGSSSGTQVENAGQAFVKYFSYDGSLEALQRYNFTHTEWATVLYNQLKTVGPVLYSGHSLGNFAHAFVCDGYDGAGYFHINWGWSGLCDGYYSLDAMTPTVQGTGGSNYGGYNFSQGMLVNVMPDKGTAFSPAAEFTLLGNMSGVCTSSVLTLTMTEANPGNLVNSSMVAITPVFAIYMEGVDNGRTAYKEVTGTYFAGQQYTLPQFSPGSFIDPQFSVKARFDSTLPDGKYKVQLVWKNKTNDNTWHNFIIPNGCHDYVYVTKNGTEYSVENLPMEYFTITSAEVLTPLYMRNPCEIQFNVTNPFDTELTQSVVPVLLYGENKVLSFEGDSQLITVGPNETTTVTLTYTFESISGGTSPTVSNPREYTLGAYDYNQLLDRYYQSGDFRESYYGDLGTATMHRPGSGSAIQMRKIAIANAVEEGMVDGVGFLYGIDDFSHINLDVTIYGKSGFVASPLSAVVYEYDPTTGRNGEVVYEKNFERLIYVEEGATSTESTVLKMTDFDPSKIYNVVIFYVQQNSRQSLGNIRFAASSGVGDISIDGGLTIAYDGFNINAGSENGIASLTVYDLSGKTVASPACNNANSVSVNGASLSQGVYLVKVTDRLGNEKVTKVIVK